MRRPEGHLQVIGLLWGRGRFESEATLDEEGNLTEYANDLVKQIRDDFGLLADWDVAREFNLSMLP